MCEMYGMGTLCTFTGMYCTVGTCLPSYCTTTSIGSPSLLLKEISQKTQVIYLEFNNLFCTVYHFTLFKVHGVHAT